MNIIKNSEVIYEYYNLRLYYIQMGMENERMGMNNISMGLNNISMEKNTANMGMITIKYENEHHK